MYSASEMPSAAALRRALFRSSGSSEICVRTILMYAQ